MPELPEVENVARGLKYLEGRRLRGIEIFDARVWFESRLEPNDLASLRLREISRRGKYLILRFERGRSLLIHLRMTGKVLAEQSPALPEPLRAQIGTEGPKALQIRCRFAFESQPVVFYDTRRFGTITAIEDEEIFFAAKGIAPDPFADEARGREHFLTKILASTRPVKAALLDQALVAGVGNIYADEALHAVGVDPRTPAAKVRDPERLWEAIRAILARSIEAGGSSVVDYLGADGEPGKFGEQLLVYGRDGEPCRACGATILRLLLAGRSTHYCPRCQPRRRA